MLLTRRKRKERKEIAVYLNNKTIPQVNSLKYLGIIFDYKLTFKENIKNMATNCTKLLFSLSKSAKLNWGLDHKALKTIYVAGILPLLIYGGPVWINAIRKEIYKSELIRVQRLINFKISKAYRTVSHEALCILTGITPIELKIEFAAGLYYSTRGNTNDRTNFDRDTGVRKWQHPVDAIIRVLKEEDEKNPIEIFTDGSRSERGVGSGVAIYRSGENTDKIQCRLNKKCTNNRAEQFAILTAMEHIEKFQTTDKIVTTYTDSQTTLDKLQNSNIRKYIV